MRDPEYRDEGRPSDLLQELGYETQDIQYRKFAVYAAYFFGFFIACIILGFVFVALMSPTGLRGGRMADYIPKTNPPLSTPLLQDNISARTDIMSLRRHETEILTSSAVLDQSKGVYRIPVDQAIDIMSQRGLPKTAPMQSGGQFLSGGGNQTVSVSGESPSGGESATSQPGNGGSGG